MTVSIWPSNETMRSLPSIVRVNNDPKEQVSKNRSVKQILREYALACLLVGAAIASVLAFIVLGPPKDSHRLRLVRFALACALVTVLGLLSLAIIHPTPLLISIPLGGVILLYLTLFTGVVRAIIVDSYEPHTPNTRLISWSGIFYSEIEIERVFNPLIADWYEEYYQAYNDGRIWKAIWLGLYYRWRLAHTMTIQMCHKVISAVLTSLTFS